MQVYIKADVSNKRKLNGVFDFTSTFADSVKCDYCSDNYVYCLYYYYYYYCLHSGLCGDFNDVEVDDFKTTNGLIERMAATFANTWKTKTSCLDVTNILKDPCNLSIDKGRPQVIMLCILISFFTTLYQ